MDFADLLTLGRQYLNDATPGGSLNPEVTRQSVLDGAAIASSPVPVLGDLLGLGADVNRYATDPSSRAAGSFALSGLGLLPFVPSMAGMVGPTKKLSREAYLINKEIFDNAHKAQDLQFNAIPISQLSDFVSIHKSPRYGTKAPSEYMVGIVNGEPAYIRKSDHWGKFTTNVKEGTSEAKAMGLGDEIGDQFGRVGFKPHNWELQGGISSQHADRIATATALRDVLPEAQRFSSIGNKLWDEIYALTKPGKREAGYILLSKLLEKKQP